MNKDFEQGAFFVKSENLAITRFTNTYVEFKN